MTFPRSHRLLNSPGNDSSGAGCHKEVRKGEPEFQCRSDEARLLISSPIEVRAVNTMGTGL